MFTYEDAVTAMGGPVELATALGVTRQYVHQWRGKIPPAQYEGVRAVCQRKAISDIERATQVLDLLEATT